MWSANSGKRLRRHQRLAHHLVVAQVFHHHQRHLFVVVVDLRRQAGGQLVVQQQRLGLEAHALAGQRPRVAGHTQVGQRLLEHHTPRRARPGASTMNTRLRLPSPTSRAASRASRGKIRLHRRPRHDVVDHRLLVEWMVCHRSVSLEKELMRRGGTTVHQLLTQMWNQTRVDFVRLGRGRGGAGRRDLRPGRRRPGRPGDARDDERGRDAPSALTGCVTIGERNWPRYMRPSAVPVRARGPPAGASALTQTLLFGSRRPSPKPPMTRPATTCGMARASPISA